MLWAKGWKQNVGEGFVLSDLAGKDCGQPRAPSPPPKAWVIPVSQRLGCLGAPNSLE